MTVSNDIKWFVQQLRTAESLLSAAIDKSEKFSAKDKKIVGKIINEVTMADLTLLKLL